MSVVKYLSAREILTPHRKAVNFISTKQIGNIEIAELSGFCYGVKRAVTTTKKLKTDNPDKEIYILGELIHNSSVIRELEELGIKTVDELPNPAPANSICVIRSHGASMDLIDKIKLMGYEVVDLTCPDVKKVQDKAVSLVLEGYFLLILGHKEHPEVMAIESNARKYSKEGVLVVKNLEELIQKKDLIKNEKRIGIVIQTTQRTELLKEILDYLIEKVPDIKIANTICHSTRLRQEEAKKMGETKDLMIVAGSKKSANTTHLAEILKGITQTIHIEADYELDNYKDIIKNASKIGITAGASTPDRIIEQIKKHIERIK